MPGLPDRSRGVPCPPAVPRRYLRFLKVKGTYQHKVVIASSTLWGCYTYWDGQRSRYCPDPLELRFADCRWGSPRWTGYLVVYQYGLRAPAILALGADAVLDCPLLQDRSFNLALRRIEVRRATDQANSPVVVRDDGETLTMPGTPVEPVQVYLGLLWGVDLTGERR